MSFGGLLGLGQSSYPLRWGALSYDKNLAHTAVTSTYWHDAAGFCCRHLLVRSRVQNDSNSSLVQRSLSCHPLRHSSSVGLITIVVLDGSDCGGAGLWGPGNGGDCA